MSKTTATPAPPPACSTSHPRCQDCDGRGLAGSKGAAAKRDCPTCRGQGFLNCDPCHAFYADEARVKYWQDREFKALTKGAR